MRRLWPERAVHLTRGGHDLEGVTKHKALRRWRSGLPCPGLEVTAEMPALRVRLVDPRQVVWRDGYPSSRRLPAVAPPGRELLQVEVAEDVAEQFRREAAERGMPVADLLAWMLRVLDVDAIRTKRASTGS